MGKRHSLSGRYYTFDYINLVIMSLIMFIMLYPFWYCLIVSFNDNSVVSYTKLTFWPGMPTLNNYRIVFLDNRIVNGFIVSILRTFIGTVLVVFCNAAMAYGLTNKKLIGRNLFLTILTIPMFFGGGIIPSYMLWKSLGLVNTFWLYVVPGLIGPFNVIIMRTFFTSTIPSSVEESAKVEGANEIYIFLKLIIPMSTPLLATFALFAAVGHWNDWFTGEFFIQNPRLHPLSTVLRRMIAMQELVQNMQNTGMTKYIRNGKAIISAESIKMAAIMVSVAPIIFVYPYLQKYFIKGMIIGSIKG